MHESSEEPDLGAADPAVMAALAGYRDRTIGAASVLAVLAKSRLLVPVVAVLDKAETTAGGARVEKSSHMATVSTTGRDGRRGLLAFTSLESLRRWRPDARPVPAPAPAVAAAALDEGADAVVVDLAGPVQFAIESHDLQALGERWTGSE
jgi:SseB protein N-terminal domain